MLWRTPIPLDDLTRIDVTAEGILCVGEHFGTPAVHRIVVDPGTGLEVQDL